MKHYEKGTQISFEWEVEDEQARESIFHERNLSVEYVGQAPMRINSLLINRLLGKWTCAFCYESRNIGILTVNSRAEFEREQPYNSRGLVDIVYPKQTATPLTMTGRGYATKTTDFVKVHENNGVVEVLIWMFEVEKKERNGEEYFQALNSQQVMRVIPVGVLDGERVKVYKEFEDLVALPATAEFKPFGLRAFKYNQGSMTLINFTCWATKFLLGIDSVEFSDLQVTYTDEDKRDIEHFGMDYDSLVGTMEDRIAIIKKNVTQYKKDIVNACKKKTYHVYIGREKLTALISGVYTASNTTSCMKNKAIEVYTDLSEDGVDVSPFDVYEYSGYPVALVSALAPDEIDNKVLTEFPFVQRAILNKSADKYYRTYGVEVRVLDTVGITQAENGWRLFPSVMTFAIKRDDYSTVVCPYLDGAAEGLADDSGYRIEHDGRWICDRVEGVYYVEFDPTEHGSYERRYECSASGEVDTVEEYKYCEITQDDYTADEVTYIESRDFYVRNDFARFNGREWELDGDAIFDWFRG